LSVDVVACAKSWLGKASAASSRKTEKERSKARTGKGGLPKFGLVGHLKVINSRLNKSQGKFQTARFLAAQRK
jgi:hypothetical protein